MANINYRSITNAVIAAADKKPGHSDTVLFAPTSDFTVIAKPTPPFTNPGDTKKITANHTFPTNKGFKTFQCKAKTVDPTGEATGEAGGQVPLYKWKCIIKGDSAHINEFVENLLNEDVICLFNDPVCGIDNYVQAGSACTPAEITGFAFRGGTKGAGGVREYEFTVQSSDKFYYSGTVTMANENPQLEAPSIYVNGISSTAAGLDWATVANADDFEVEYGTASNFSGATATTTGGDTEIIFGGLTANTRYFVRVRTTAPNFAPSEWAVVSFKTAP